MPFKAQCYEHSIQKPQENRSKVGWDVFLLWLIMLPIKAANNQYLKNVGM